MELKSKKWKQTIVKWIICNDELEQINFRMINKEKLIIQQL